MKLYCSAQVGREDTFKHKIQKDSLHVTIFNGLKRELCHLQIFNWQSKMLPYLNIRKYTWIPRDVKTRNQIEDGRSVYLIYDLSEYRR